MSAPLKASSSLLKSSLFRAGPPSLHDAARVAAVTGKAEHAAPRAPVLQAVGQRLAAQFARRPQRSADREASVSRRRKWGGSSGLPDSIRANYTEGERAALAVVAQEVRVKGFCDLHLDRIAAVAGVSRTTCQNALRQARALGHVVIELRPIKGRRNLSNVVRIAALEWKAWLQRCGRAAESIGFKPLNPSEKRGSDIGKRTPTNHVTECGRAEKRLGEGSNWRRWRASPGGVQA